MLFANLLNCKIIKPLVESKGSGGGGVDGGNRVQQGAKHAENQTCKDGDRC